MAETIKGINVVIGADTSGLSAALGDVNKRSRDIQSELKQVDKLLKLDPGNTELVAQKQKLLADSIENTKEKLSRLKQVQEQVNEQFKAGTISEGQYRAFQREIVQTEQQLKTFEQALETTGQKVDQFAAKTGNAADKLKNVGSGMKNAGANMTAGLTLPLVGIGAAAINAAGQVEGASSTIQARLGATAEEADRLSEAARGIWEQGFGESIDEVSLALTTVEQNIQDLNDADLEKLTTNALVLQKVFGADVTESVRTASVMMKNFGIDGNTAFDLMTVGFQKGGDFSGELLDTLREYAPQFASMGISASDAMGILISGANAGAFNLDKVGDALKEFNIRAQDGSKTTADGFAAIGLDATTMANAISAGGETASNAFQATITALAAMKDPVQQNIAGVNLFGTQWEDLRSKVIFAMQDGIGSLNEFEGAADKAGAALQDNPLAEMTALWRQLQSDLAPLGTALIELAQTVLPPLIAMVSQVAQWFSNLSPSTQKLVGVIGALAAVIGPLLIAFGAIVSAIGTLMPVFVALTGPIGLVIAAIAALAAGVYLVIKNWDTIKAFFSGLWDWMVNFFKKWGVEILAIVAPFIGIPLLIVKHWDDIKAGLSAVWDWISSTSSKVFKAVVNSISNAWEDVKNRTADNWNAIVGAISKAIDWIKGLPKQMLEIGKNIIQGIVDGITGSIGKIKDKIKEIASTITDGIKGLLDIHSPSRVMMAIGEFTGEGMALGLQNSVAEVSRQASSLAKAAVPKSSDFSAATSGGGAAAAGAATGGSQPVVVPVYLDGREIARATSGPMANMNMTRSRGLGLNGGL
ncbi:TP901 family phage tail tape measure protein [Paenibacillus sp. BK033]|uniref:phage tail tape measure protein n=1 Tax=Paenibacillus sp. BK033 TaxID=2512133 RepID=UPI00104E923E|nr:phage tail tape measure protein [Paenibacillus sp. BK033]TCN00863.1 TP901 family phage tail tape measure protein [Paenibacillus sp. BK033]